MTQLLMSFIDLIIHLDKHILELFNYYGVWSTAILFVVIFCETGLVVTPFLPGDSLLFVIGALGASGEINIFLITVLLIVAALVGNIVNYYIGRLVGPQVFNGRFRFFKMEYLLRTHRFYERHGGKTIIISRFMPIIRTFAPFVAGIGKMNFARFFVFNLIGGCSWVLIFILGGYFFGNIPSVRKNFTVVIMAVIVLSLMPAIISAIINKYKSKDEIKCKRAP